MNIPKVVMYTCTKCGASKDETLMDGYPRKIAPRKPTCRLCVRVAHSKQHARALWKKKPRRMMKLAGLSKRATPSILAPNGSSIQNPALYRSYPTDTYLADGRFGAIIFSKK